MLGVEGFADEEDEDVIDDDELYDDDEDDFEDDEDDLDEEDEDFEDDEDEEDEEELSGGIDVEAIYEQADLLLDEFQDYLKDCGVAREDRVNYDEMLQVFVDDYLAAYEVGKLTDMTRDEIDTYLREFCSNVSASRNGSWRRPSRRLVIFIPFYPNGVTCHRRSPNPSFNTVSA